MSSGQQGGSKLASTDTRINWQAKYLEQIEARLAGLERGQRLLEEKIDAGLRELRRLHWSTIALIVGSVLAAAARLTMAR